MKYKEGCNLAKGVDYWKYKYLAFPLHINCFSYFHRKLNCLEKNSELKLKVYQIMDVYVSLGMLEFDKIAR